MQVFNHERFKNLCQQSGTSLKAVIFECGYKTEMGYYTGVKNNTIPLSFAINVAAKFGKSVDYFLNDDDENSIIADPLQNYVKASPQNVALSECRARLIQLQDKVIRLQDEMIAMQKKAGAKG